MSDPPTSIPPLAAASASASRRVISSLLILGPFDIDALAPGEAEEGARSA
ncbi:MAG TPA: hypothetical protein VFA23_14590 [Dongiaceae bacterium]|nr:hypothetical protein [Dongiaceae bacterium]